MSKIRLAFSSCPNDTFIFDAIANKRISLDGLDFEITVGDVEELNRKALAGELDITKLSFYAYAQMHERFELCESGSALGHGNGPLLVSKQRINPNEVRFLKIAIPGRHTTANFLLKHAYPGIAETHEYLFSKIEQAVLDGEVDAGVLIHEGRFTYQKKGLRLITDLGEYWEKTTGNPVPLGCIAMRRELPEETRRAFEQLLLKSIRYAIQNPFDSKEYMHQHAQSQSPEVILQHLTFFVNEYTIELGDEGRKAAKHFVDEVHRISGTEILSTEILGSE